MASPMRSRTARSLDDDILMGETTRRETSTASGAFTTAVQPPPHFSSTPFPRQQQQQQQQRREPRVHFGPPQPDLPRTDRPPPSSTPFGAWAAGFTPPPRGRNPFFHDLQDLERSGESGPGQGHQSHQSLSKPTAVAEDFDINSFYLSLPPPWNVLPRIIPKPNKVRQQKTFTQGHHDPR